MNEKHNFITQAGSNPKENSRYATTLVNPLIFKRDTIKIVLSTQLLHKPQVRPGRGRKAISDPNESITSRLFLSKNVLIDFSNLRKLASIAFLHILKLILDLSF